MSSGMSLLLFWLIPIACVVIFLLTIINISRKQKKALELWRQSNQLLQDRIEQSQKRIDEIEAKLGDTK